LPFFLLNEFELLDDCVDLCISKISLAGTTAVILPASNLYFKESLIGSSKVIFFCIAYANKNLIES